MEHMYVCMCMCVCAVCLCVPVRAVCMCVPVCVCSVCSMCVYVYGPEMTLFLFPLSLLTPFPSSLPYPMFSAVGLTISTRLFSNTWTLLLPQSSKCWDSLSSYQRLKKLNILYAFFLNSCDLQSERLVLLFLLYESLLSLIVSCAQGAFPSSPTGQCLQLRATLSVGISKLAHRMNKVSNALPSIYTCGSLQQSSNTRWGSGGQRVEKQSHKANMRFRWNLEGCLVWGVAQWQNTCWGTRLSLRIVLAQ